MTSTVRIQVTLDDSHPHFEVLRSMPPRKRARWVMDELRQSEAQLSNHEVVKTVTEKLSKVDDVVKLGDELMSMLRSSLSSGSAASSHVPVTAQAQAQPVHAEVPVQKVAGPAKSLGVQTQPVEKKNRPETGMGMLAAFGD